MAPVGLSPDGKLTIESMKKDAKWMYEHGYVKKPVNIDEIVDTTWAENAVKKLGPYQPPAK